MYQYPQYSQCSPCSAPYNPYDSLLQSLQLQIACLRAEISGLSANSSGSTSGGSVISALNEIVGFTNLSILTLPWTSTRKTNFGDAGMFQVEIVGEDSVLRVEMVEIIPNIISGTSSYQFSFGRACTGRIIIS